MTPNDAPGPGGAPGSVAEEAALLVDLLTQRGWGGSSGMPSGAPRANGHSTQAPSEAAGSSRTGEGDGDRSGTAHECTCGGTTPAACRVCPVCQLIAFVQQVNPDTIDRVADFVGFAATALRDLATAQRERRSEPDDGETGTTPPGSAS